MKELSKRQAMEILLAGGKVDYWMYEGVKGVASPLSWCEEHGIINRDGTTDLDWFRLVEYKEPKKLDVWIAENIFNKRVHCIGDDYYELGEGGHSDLLSQYSSDMNEAMPILNTLPGSCSLFSTGYYNGAQTYGVYYEDHEIWLSLEEPAAMALCLAAYQFKTGEEWNEHR